MGLYLFPSTVIMLPQEWDFSNSQALICYSRIEILLISRCWLRNGTQQFLTHKPFDIDLVVLTIVLTIENSPYIVSCILSILTLCSLASSMAFDEEEICNVVPGMGHQLYISFQCGLQLPSCNIQVVT